MTQYVFLIAAVSEHDDLNSIEDLRRIYTELRSWHPDGIPTSTMAEVAGASCFEYELPDGLLDLQALIYGRGLAWGNGWTEYDTFSTMGKRDPLTGEVTWVF